MRAALAVHADARVSTSVKARLKDRGSVHRGDVVLVDLGGRAAAAEVVALWDAYGVVGAMLLMVYDLASWSPRSATAKWTVHDDMQYELISLDNIVCSVIYRKYGCTLATLVPHFCRRLFE